MLVCLFLFLFCFFCFFFFSVSFLLILLFLELALLVVFFMMFLVYFILCGLPSIFLFLLPMVCMGAFGISLLIFCTRFFGGDFWMLYFIF